jgi:hypothetical protein
MRFRCGLLVAFLCAFPLAAAAQLTEERSAGLRVIYFDVTESYLVPHATRTALNSLAFQKKLFGFDPREDVTVLLLDLSDSGNAGASSVPGDLVSVQIAPLGFSFETLAANERMNLTRITDRSAAEIQHVADALTLLPHLSADPITLADVGSGGRGAGEHGCSHPAGAALPRSAAGRAGTLDRQRCSDSTRLPTPRIRVSASVRRDGRPQGRVNTRPVLRTPQRRMHPQALASGRELRRVRARQLCLSPGPRTAWRWLVSIAGGSGARSATPLRSR